MFNCKDSGAGLGLSAERAWERLSDKERKRTEIHAGRVDFRFFMVGRGPAERPDSEVRGICLKKYIDKYLCDKYNVDR